MEPNLLCTLSRIFNKTSQPKHENFVYRTNTCLTKIPLETQSTAMLFSEEDAPLLKAFIVKRLENTYVHAASAF